MGCNGMGWDGMGGMDGMDWMDFDVSLYADFVFFFSGFDFDFGSDGCVGFDAGFGCCVGSGKRPTSKRPTKQASASSIGG